MVDPNKMATYIHTQDCVISPRFLQLFLCHRNFQLKILPVKLSTENHHVDMVVLVEVIIVIIA